MHLWTWFVESRNCLGWKISLRLLSPTFHQTPPGQTDHGTYCNIQVFLGVTIPRDVHHLRGQSIPKFNSPFHEEFPPSVQPGPPLVQLEAISSSPISGFLGEESNPKAHWSQRKNFTDLSFLPRLGVWFSFFPRLNGLWRQQGFADKQWDDSCKMDTGKRDRSCTGAAAPQLLSSQVPKMGSFCGLAHLGRVCQSAGYQTKNVQMMECQRWSACPKVLISSMSVGGCGLCGEVCTAQTPAPSLYLLLVLALCSPCFMFYA